MMQSDVSKCDAVAKLNGNPWSVSGEGKITLADHEMGISYRVQWPGRSNGTKCLACMQSARLSPKSPIPWSFLGFWEAVD